MIHLERLKLSLLASAFTIFAAIPNSALADSVSISASVSTEIKVEINTDSADASKMISYSGVIVDCRGLGLRTSASPVIKNENGKIIYGDKNLDFDLINEIGMAEYTTSIQDSTARAGAHPLIVRAVKLDNFNCNPVLSNNDAERVLLANGTSEFFKELKVVFLTD